MKNLLLLLALAALVSCKSQALIYPSTPEKPLYKVAIFYPTGANESFDLAYYESTHMPMVAGYLGDNLVFYEIDKGLSGRTPNDPYLYSAIGYFYIKDIGEYNLSISKNREAILSDFKNYTSVQPIIQISEVKHVGFSKPK